MIVAAALFAILLVGFIDGCRWALVRRTVEAARRRVLSAREVWPPRRVIETRATVEDTF